MFKSSTNQSEIPTLMTSQWDHCNALLQILNTGYNDFTDNQHEHLFILVHSTMESIKRCAQTTGH